MENELTDKTAYQQLSEQETKEVLTPFAFNLDESLFGLPLASPWKRAVAIAIDGLLIAMLSSAGGEFLAIFLALAFYRMSSKRYAKIAAEAEPDKKSAKQTKVKVKGRKRRAFYRLMAAFIIFLVLIDILPPLLNPLLGDNSNEQISEKLNSAGVLVDPGDLTLEQKVELTVLAAATFKKVKDNDCTTANCWQEALSEVPEQLSLLSIPKSQAKELFTDIANETELTKKQRQQLSTRLNEQYLQLALANGNQAAVPEESRGAEQLNSPGVNVASDNSVKPSTSENQPAAQQEPKTVTEQGQPSYSLTDLLMGFIEKDLGLGFGWAAFYFTVFTAWWQGQTPGKRLMKIKVLQLDGTPLSLWDSFGRHGGYAAGLATGLLGFAQVFWNPNRQAIHDQISATVVIDVTATDKY
jgi:uncharacterized RDD family membrane protein YckC